MILTAVAIEIRGKVQGVWFRVHTKNEADRLGVCGMVKNKTDGSVYIEACADQESLGKFILWCLRGPDHAEVTEIKIIPIPGFQSNNFTITR